MIVSYYKNSFDTVGEPKKLSEILKDIKSTRWLLLASKVQSLEGEERSQFKKNKLPAFTLSGTFPPEQREDAKAESHSGLIGVDVDEDRDGLGEAFKADPYTFCCFRSVSGSGWCVVVKIPKTLDPEEHKEYGRGLEVYFMEKYGIKVDPTFKNLARLRFISYDEELYGNKDSLVWNTRVEAKRPQLSELKTTGMPDEIRVQRLLFNFVKSYGEFSSCASRHEYVYHFAVWCNRAGVSMDYAIHYAIENYPIPERDYNKEHRRSIEHCYSSSAAEFGTKVPEEFYNADDLKRFPQHSVLILGWLLTLKLKSYDDYKSRPTASEKYADMLRNEIEILTEIHYQLCSR